MKKPFVLLIFFLLSFTLSCKDNCINTEIPTCQEKVPTNENCQAVFNRWFYNSETGQCEEKTYSGCSQKGFATEMECKECKCK